MAQELFEELANQDEALGLQRMAKDMLSAMARPEEQVSPEAPVSPKAPQQESAPMKITPEMIAQARARIRHVGIEGARKISPATSPREQIGEQIRKGVALRKVGLPTREKPKGDWQKIYEKGFGLMRGLKPTSERPAAEPSSDWD